MNAPSFTLARRLRAEGRRPVPANALGLTGTFGLRRASDEVWYGLGGISTDEDWAVDPATVQSVHLESCALPTYAQKVSDCNGHATANCIEMQARLLAERISPGAGAQVFPAGQQVDGYRLYMRTRAIEYGDQDRDAGTRLGEPQQTAVAEGLVAPDTRIIRVPVGAHAVSACLRLGQPMVGGFIVTQEWLDAGSDGVIAPCDPLHAKILGGHAVAIIGIVVRGGKVYYQILNSWGSKWGFHGMGFIEYPFVLQYLMGEPHVALVPGPKSTGWRVPEPYLVGVAEEP